MKWNVCASCKSYCWCEKCYSTAHEEKHKKTQDCKRATRIIARLVKEQCIERFNYRCLRCEALANTMKICTGCHTAHYCNTDCQRADWLEHKQECSSLI